MKFGNRPIIAADDIAMFCAAFGFALGMLVLAATAFFCIMLAAMFAPIAIAIACVVYVIDVLRIWWEHA